MPALEDPREERLLNWLLMPEDQREPKTKKELAAELGISETTIQKWPKNYHFSQEYDRRWRALAGGPEKVEAAVNRLYEIAMGGNQAANVTAMKLWLEWRRELKKDEGPGVDAPPDLRDLSDEELLRRIQAHQPANA